MVGGAIGRAMGKSGEVGGELGGSWVGPGGPDVTCSHSEEEEDLAQAQSWADT